MDSTMIGRVSVIRLCAVPFVHLQHILQQLVGIYISRFTPQMCFFKTQVH